MRTTEAEYLSVAEAASLSRSSAFSGSGSMPLILPPGPDGGRSRGVHPGVHRTRFPGIPDTYDPRNHAGLGMATRVVMGGTGLEPVTPSLSSWCSPN